MINPTFFVIGLAVFASSVATYAQSPSLLIENVTLIDGTGRQPVSGAFVLTDGDRIVRISRERIDAPNGTVRIDGRGKYLIPGLMDMHIHLRGGRGRPVSREFVLLMAARKIPMVSTLTIGEGYSRLVEHPEFLDQPLYQSVYEPETIRRLKTDVRDRYAARSWTTWMKVMTPVAQENLRQINEAGGIIVLGSDQSSGPASHRELELMVAGGIPELEAIRIGTFNAAIFLGKERDMGSIEEGKLADMVLLQGNPLDDISNAQKIELVIKGGRIVDRRALDLPANR